MLSAMYRSFPKQILGLGALACLMVCQGGCLFETPPNVKVRGVHILEVGTAESPSVKLGVELTLENPTQEPIQLEEYDYQVIVESEGQRERWSGSWSALRTLPSGDNVEMVVPAVVPYTFVNSPETASWRVSGTISYKAPGRLAQILFDSGFRRPKHGFSGRGLSITPTPDSPDKN